MVLTKADHSSFAEAIESGDIQCVSKLVEKHPELVNHPDWTPPPLHCAILWNQPAIAELLLECGADIELLDPDRQTTPLRYAIMYCKTELIPVLLRKGAHTGAVVDNGTTALQLAKEAANGAYEEFDDLPKRDEYGAILKLLEQSGLAE